ncbi:acyl-CoA dehydratase activase [Desulfosporosinus meridiei]|uniref:CoA-substrate-specific enzyme activase, putative n=1 Tax=Desulfosporosinus meridiei (strain ATCC BAA-275 / DSM 13257 / KCTC 12902 / NCIMB 13706 / S10) TaxID=768704 RepID=J7J4L6_DESMD|nr:acyl-CoA dehydratase activase [Desulfosporosinus meridiei]AFQ46223.1 CoA-substrate-specific enzyme activase, putative [Desulfosporosinus meridiei DSM 13257]
MSKAYLGIDIGSISTKGVIIDEKNNIKASEYLWTEGDPLKAVKRLLSALKLQLADSQISIVAVGTTGSARKLIGAMTGATVVKNEITAQAIGAMSVHPEVRTIIEIGGQDSKIILIENGIVIDYAMNTLCAAGTGAFLSSQAQRLHINIEDFGKIALQSTKATPIAARCTVFAESDLVHKAQIGHKKEDIVAGLCQAVVANYLNNVGKGKKITSPVVFQGGVSKNVGVVKAFEELLGMPVAVGPNSHLTGALGVALLAKKSRVEKDFFFDITDIEFKTVGYDCKKCSNNCEIICIYREDQIIDAWGNKCENGAITKSPPHD